MKSCNRDILLLAGVSCLVLIAFTGCAKSVRSDLEGDFSDWKTAVGVKQEEEFILRVAPSRVSEWRKHAENGSPYGQVLLGKCHSFGSGVAKDHEKAVGWYRLAASQGMAAAECEVGRCFEYGNGVDEDLEEAVKWYRRAAEQSYAQGQFCLGSYFNFSIGGK